MKDENLKNTYNKIARDWSGNHGGDVWWRKYVEELSNLLPKGAKVLDIGCAQGFKSNYLMLKGFDVTSIDFSEEMIKVARETYPTGKFQVFDLYDLENFPGKFDCVFSMAVLLHVPPEEIFQVMKNMSGKLNPGGLCLVSVKGPMEGKKADVVKAHEYGYEYERKFYYYTNEEIENYFKNAGFEVVLSDSCIFEKTVWVVVIAKKL